MLSNVLQFLRVLNLIDIWAASWWPVTMTARGEGDDRVLVQPRV